MKLIILDRDGVINTDSDDYIKSPTEWLPIDGSLAAIARLYQAGYTIAVATNQSGVGRGLYTEETLHLIHQKMLTAVAAHGGKIEKIFYCPHVPADNCECRKPKPGLLLQASRYFNYPFNHNVIFIGDTLRDVHAARAAACIPYFVRTGYGQEMENKYREELKDVKIFADLATAVDNIMAVNFHEH